MDYRSHKLPNPSFLFVNKLSQTGRILLGRMTNAEAVGVLLGANHDMRKIIVYWRTLQNKLNEVLLLCVLYRLSRRGCALLNIHILYTLPYRISKQAPFQNICTGDRAARVLWCVDKGKSGTGQQCNYQPKSTTPGNRVLKKKKKQPKSMHSSGCTG